jgi:hypothetical protein
MSLPNFFVTCIALVSLVSDRFDSFYLYFSAYWYKSNRKSENVQISAKGSIALIATIQVGNNVWTTTSSNFEKFESLLTINTIRRIIIFTIAQYDECE